jgi:hypothetical protein
VIVLGVRKWTGFCGPFSSGPSGDLKEAMTRWMKADAKNEDLTVDFVNGDLPDDEYTEDKDADDESDADDEDADDEDTYDEDTYDEQDWLVAPWST